MRYFLAFSYNVHDSSVSVADEQRVLLVLEAERVFGEKKKRCDHAEMEQLIGIALRHVGITIDQVEGVACTAYKNEHLPDEARDVSWTSECKVLVQGRKFQALVLNHHLAHAAMVHAFPEATDTVIDVCDGGGDFGDCHFVYRCRDHRIELLPSREIHKSFSSRCYDIVSRYLYGGIMNEGKLMALASLGAPRPEMLAFVRDHVSMFHSAPPEESMAVLRKHYPVERYITSQVAFDLAASVQRVFEELRVQSVAELPSDAPYVMLAGGSTLNIVANTRVREYLGKDRHLLLPPCCDDTGQSVGALLYYCHERAQAYVTCNMPFLGYSDRIDDSTFGPGDVKDELVEFLVRGGVAFLHRGQSEIGPRALGHRSIIALPSKRSYDVINNVIKQREFYRPLAPFVPLESVSEWFEWQGESHYMLYAARATERTRLAAPGICHYDDSARLQTIDGRDPFLHALLERVGQATGCPILINTSLNPKGIPILSKLQDTRAFAQRLSGLDIRVFAQGQLLRSQA